MLLNFGKGEFSDFNEYKVYHRLLSCALMFSLSRTGLDLARHVGGVPPRGPALGSVETGLAPHVEAGLAPLWHAAPAPTPKQGLLFQ